MPLNNFYQNLISLTAKRSVEATISILGITDKNLRRHLVEEMGGSGNDLGLLADPIFEATFPWEKSKMKMSDLAGDLLEISLVEAMDKSGEHRFGRDWNPFKHQLDAWSTVMNSSRKSLVVTSGTGSGKTECFMVPILNDLVREYERDLNPLIGVRALFIYPLNALINSQRERLRAWTNAYGSGLRFCLYNGNTEENKHKDSHKYPNEILTRKLMRDTPAPMLVTNSTMLEYMLVRQIDNPIIQQSQGKLRWIVLDEAHSYIGSQAAELSLLLRRVMHTFGVQAKDVRFVATSATMGGKEGSKQLQEYLAKLSGVDIEQVIVVGGKREIPSLIKPSSNNMTLDELINIDVVEHFSTSRYEALSGNVKSIKLRKALTDSPIPKTLSVLSEKLFGDTHHRQETLQWIDVCSNTSKPGVNAKKPVINAKAFLPIRAHLFHQVLSGLWCCSDKNCSEKEESTLDNNWPFGRVYSQRSNNCKCGSPIFELLFCNECNAPHLMAIKSGEYLIQMDRESVDEFSLDYEEEEEIDSSHDELISTDKVVISSASHDELTYPISIDRKRRLLPMSPDTIDLNFIDPSNIGCPCCEYTSRRAPFYRRSLLGTPFYISNAIPTLLDSCQESENANERPSRGKRLITFTDSRQGTARISIKIQQDSERDSIRGMMYGATANNVANIDNNILKRDKEKLNTFQKKATFFRVDGDNDTAKIFDELANEIIQKLSRLGVIKSLSWNDAVIKLQASPDISSWIFDYYKGLNPLLFPDNGGARALTEMLLLREFSRRPKRKNSLETLGLVSIQYPLLKQIKVVPEGWKNLDLTIDDWLDFLKVILDFYVRENSIIAIPDEWIDWMGAKIYPKTVLKYDSTEPTNSRIRRWPQVVPGRNNRLIRMLCMACDLNIGNRTDKDLINSILKNAWRVLTASYTIQDEQTGLTELKRILTPVPATVRMSLDRTQISFQTCSQAWICPFTNRLLDSTFKGISPYLPYNAKRDEVICRLVDVPICQVDAASFSSELERKQSVRNWVAHEQGVKTLRAENLWTDISDKIIEGGSFYRAAEHSAQQPASKLTKYEADFKTGRLNVLSCSTTMEMGVDIGGINVVAMNNVPPHPANYLQRSGRAGRRGETQALSFTICKDNPHERGVFKNPLWPFTTAIDAPYIVLSSDRIVQRHINALLLSYFLKEIINMLTISITTLNCQWFFASEVKTEAPAQRMVRWLASFKHEKMPMKLERGIKSVVKDSVLSGNSLEKIITQSIDSLNTVKDRWLPSFQKVELQLSKLESLSDKDPFKRKVTYDLKCLGDAYLLSELASNSFLPGYGFPTGLATFDHYSISDYKRGTYRKKSGRIDNRTRMRERPSRDMAIAIREYAPGADIVLDGLVYRSAGILLNEFSPNADYSEPQKLTKEWRCHSCGFIGNEFGSVFDEHCSQCGTELKQKNIKEYIEPAGFAVDFISSPTTDISAQMYVPVQEPWVTANSELHLLFEPRLGSYRCNSHGHIFNHSSGEHGTGFAVCLRCGRAESMTADNDLPSGLGTGVPHYRLQGRPDPESSSTCEGGDEVYAIKSGIHLGSTNQTDVFELYLKNPNENMYMKHRKHDPLPWTLAVVLRQSLADIHGINSDEMGYIVKPSTVSGCEYPVAGIALYDRNGGGAGFSSAAPRHLREMYSRALEHLECADNCDSACQSCLMGYDTRFHIDLLNRHVAKEYIQCILPYLDVALEAQVFGENTNYCVESLSAEILSGAAQGANKLRIFTGGSFLDWDIGSSNLKETCLNWREAFEIVELVLPSSEIKSLSDLQKEDLLALVRFGIRLSVFSDSDNLLIKKGCLLAQLTSDKQVISFASNALITNVPNNDWWEFDGHYLVRTKDLNEVKVIDFESEFLAVNKGSGDLEIEIISECDGKVEDFGDKLWSEFIEKSEVLKKSINSPAVLQNITYSDCYISSPWSLILFAEIIDSLKKLLDDKWDHPAIILFTSDKEPSQKTNGVYADWRSSSTKSDVIVEYFEQMNEEIEVNIKSMREMPHGRQLTLSWDDGSISQIRFDHGVGCWSIDKGPSKWFNIEAEPEIQVEDMFKMIKGTTVIYKKQFPTQIFIKKR